MPALALTDHGNLFGAIEFYDKAQGAGHQADHRHRGLRRAGRPHRSRPAAARAATTWCCWPANATGYRNLIKLTTRSYLDGFYYKPRIDHELLRQHAEGLIGLSACLKGEINERIVSRPRAGGRGHRAHVPRHLRRGQLLPRAPGPRHPRAARRQRRAAAPRRASSSCRWWRPTTATTCARTTPSPTTCCSCIGTQRTLSTIRTACATPREEFYLKSAAEMTALFPEDPQAVENTLRIAERCDLQLQFGALPPAGVPGADGRERRQLLRTHGTRGPRAALRRAAAARSRGLRAPRGRGLRRAPALRARRHPAAWASPATSSSSGTSSATPASSDIPVGPGRGSAAGSLVSYALRITDIDPLQYDLLFERFLNPERISMPDIDIDFCQRRRGEVHRST